MIKRTPTVCQSKCQLHPTLHYCAGCYRTIEQISNWSKYTQEEKNKILNISPPNYSKNYQKESFQSFVSLRTITLKPGVA